MLKSFKGRELKEGQQVKVYFHLRVKLFSVQDAKTGLVLAHGNNIILKDVTFKVSEKGRQRVLREQEKHVHAYAIGEYLGTMSAPISTDHMKEAYYNPYKVDNFMVDGEKAGSYSMAVASDKKVYVS